MGRHGTRAVRMILLGVLVSVGALGEAVAQGIAWWVTATFQPSDEAVEGIPVRQLNSRWLRASTITRSVLPVEAMHTGETVEEHGFSFVLDADLDGDGRQERALVGVFQTVSGETGRFLLILGRSRHRAMDQAGSVQRNGGGRILGRSRTRWPAAMGMVP